MGEYKICYKCMEKYNSALHVCTSCGYAENTPSNPMYITPGTILHDRYLVGVLLEYNGEGATYIALDSTTDCAVTIREYMPINLCTRATNSSDVLVTDENRAKFKAFLAEYTELNKSLAKLRTNSNITPVLDMFSANKTAYTVFENIDGVKMIDYLKDNAGELSWEQISKLFPTMFTTLGMLHNTGIIHRAISPETVYVTNKGELKITGFCISAVRTADAGLEYELFKGYSAPEQHSSSSNSRQGSWTDVYSVCALMYRCLTGCMPVDAISRLKDDSLCEPRLLSAKIPRHVSKIIMEGMSLSGCERIQNITELVTKLFEQPVARTIRNAEPKTEIIPVTQVRERQYAPPHEEYYDDSNNYQDNNASLKEESYRYETVDRLKVPVIIGILLIAILMIIAVFIINMVTDTQKNKIGIAPKREPTTASDNVVSGDSEEEETVPPKPDTFMPDLVGKYYELSAEKYHDFFNLEAKYEYNNEYDVDMIFWQNVDPGEQLVGGRATVKVKVSMGRETAIIPEFEDMTVVEYQKKLKEAGITNYSIIATKTTGVKPDVVFSLQVESKEVKPGSTFSNKEGKKLIVYYFSKDVNVSIQDLNKNEESTTSSNQNYYATEQPTTYYTPQTTQQIYTEEPTYNYIETYPPVTQPVYTEEPTYNYVDPYPPVTDVPQANPSGEENNFGGNGIITPENLGEGDSGIV
ncbi:MAG: protein kinase [Ruminococcus sp.]|nr:protein kinase [Ruminococcus sp.]